MAEPTTLAGLAQRNVDDWTARLSTAQSAVTTAQAALDTAVTALAAATAALAAANADAAEARAALAVIPTSGDADPLTQDLETAIVAQRAAAADILTHQRDQALAADALARAERDLAEAEAGKTAADSALEAADREATRVAAMLAALAAPPLDTLIADAGALLASQTATDADTAAELGFPAELLTRARSRVAIARQRIHNRAASRDAFAALIADQVADNGNKADKLAAPRAAYAVALTALEDFALGAAQRYERAEGALTRLADPNQKVPMTAEQVAALNDVDLAAARTAAAADELARDEAVRDREAAEQARDLEQVKQDTGLPDDLANAQDALDTALTNETDAENDYSPDDRATMSAWEAAAPDTAWEDLAGYDDGVDALTKLAAAVPANLSTDLTIAESALVTDELALRDEQAALAHYNAELAARTARAEWDAENARRIVFGALRGDG